MANLKGYNERLMIEHVRITKVLSDKQKHKNPNPSLEQENKIEIHQPGDNIRESKQGKNDKGEESKIVTEKGKAKR